MEEREIKNKLTNEQKKEYAQMLYTQAKITQKEIAQKVGVSEKTLSAWVHDGNWAKMRQSIMTTKGEQLSIMYMQIEELNKAIYSRDEGKRFADSKEADTLLKMTAAIKNLEVETSAAEIMEVGIKFVKFVQKINLDHAKLITTYLDEFIKEKLKH